MKSLDFYFRNRNRNRNRKLFDSIYRRECSAPIIQDSKLSFFFYLVESTLWATAWLGAGWFLFRPVHRRGEKSGSRTEPWKTSGKEPVRNILYFAKLFHVKFENALVLNFEMLRAVECLFSTLLTCQTLNFNVL